jgi:lysozyme family protein
MGGVDRVAAAPGVDVFPRAFAVVEEHEGAVYTDDPSDHGGPTCRGLTLTLFRAWKRRPEATAEELSRITRDDVMACFRECFWEPYGYGRVADPIVATKLLDTTVNLGPARAHRIAQLAASRCGHHLLIDGVLGSKSLAALNASEPRPLLRVWCSEQREYYLRLISADPTQARFRAGWLRRAAWPWGALEGFAAC